MPKTQLKRGSEVRSNRIVGTAKPSWSVCYRIGVEYQRRLHPRYTLEEVGSAFGLTKQNAYTATVLALGKLIYLVRRKVGHDS